MSDLHVLHEFLVLFKVKLLIMKPLDEGKQAILNLAMKIIQNFMQTSLPHPKESNRALKVL